MNLKQPTVEILLNSVTSAELGIFTDSITGYKNLVFKTKGITIPYVTGQTTQNFSKTSAGVKNQYFIGFNGTLPCELCNYEYGISLKAYVKKPGVNTSHYQPHQKWYGNVIGKILETSNVWDTTQIASMLSTIISLVNADEGYLGAPDYTFPGAPATAYYAYEITRTSETNTLTVNGTALTANRTRDQFVTEIDAISGVSALAHPTDATKLYIWSATAITLASATGVTTQAGVYFIDTWFDYLSYGEADTTYWNTVQVVNGSYSRLTYDDVFATFASQPRNHGYLSQLTWAVQPLKEDYVKINIKYPHILPSLDGASHRSAIQAEVNVYIPKSVIDSTSDDWTLATPMTTVAVGAGDKTLDEITALLATDGWKTIVAAL